MIYYVVMTFQRLNLEGLQIPLPMLFAVITQEHQLPSLASGFVYNHNYHIAMVKLTYI